MLKKYPCCSGIKTHGSVCKTCHREISHGSVCKTCHRVFEMREKLNLCKSAIYQVNSLKVRAKLHKVELQGFSTVFFFEYVSLCC